MATRIVLTNYEVPGIKLSAGDIIDDAIVDTDGLTEAGAAFSAASPAAGLLTAAEEFRSFRDVIDVRSWSGHLAAKLLAASGTV